MKNNFYFFNNYIFVHMFQWTSSKYFFFNFRFSSRKSQSLQKLAEKVTYFTIQFCSKTSLISRTSTHSTLKKNFQPIYSQPRTFLTLQIFPQTSGWCQRKHLHCAISRRPRTAFPKHLESKCLCISVYLRKNIFVPETQ